MPYRCGITIASIDLIAASLWPSQWANASLQQKCILRVGIGEVCDGGTFEYPALGVKAKDTHRIKEAWVKIQNSSHELFKEAPLAPDKV